MAYQQNPGQGSLFVNDRKATENQPDLTGSITIPMDAKPGDVIRISGWNKYNQDGSFARISLAAEVRQQQAPAQGQPQYQQPAYQQAPRQQQYAPQGQYPQARPQYQQQGYQQPAQAPAAQQPQYSHPAQNPSFPRQMETPLTPAQVAAQQQMQQPGNPWQRPEFYQGQPGNDDLPETF